MFDKIIAYSIENKFVVGLLTAALVVWGVYSLGRIPIDAVPDITNNQVQVITTSPTLATQEVEQFITTPVELSLQNLQNLVEIRSISRFGLSVVTVVFEEDMDLYLARQLVSEHLREARENIPPGLGNPEMAPISTGLGEIYHYVLRAEEGYEQTHSLTDLRTLQDWLVARRLSGLEGVVEINTTGGYLKQYEVAVDPNRLKSRNVSLLDVLEALEASNENTGGAYIEKNSSTYYIRTEGLIGSFADIENVLVSTENGVPVRVGDLATVGFGRAPRYGALVHNGEETVGGRVMMLRGANSAAVTERVKERIAEIQQSLPEGVVLQPYLVRDKLVNTAIATVQTNLIEGGLIVIFILVLMLGNWRAGLVVASVIPLSMLFAISMMNVLGISANLMSLGAIDFGLIVDGAVIIVEAIVHRLQTRFPGQQLSAARMNAEVQTAAQRIRGSAAFGEIIILMVYLPILALTGIEGKMFRPMAQTVTLAIAGALILSLTYVPMMAALVLNKRITDRRTLADRIVAFFYRLYAPLLRIALRFRAAVIGVTILLFVVSIWAFTRMGGEFIPTLEEGDLAMQQILPPGTSLSQSVEISKLVQRRLLSKIPDIEEVVVNIGSAEIPTDPMPVEIGDYTLVMKPKSEWTVATDRQGMFEAIEEALHIIPGVAYEFSQPIQLRFNELMTGSKADIAVKLYGEDLDLLAEKASEAEAIIARVAGVGTVNLEQTLGMPQIVVDYQYDRMAQYGLRTRDVNHVVRTAFAGYPTGVVYEGDRRFELVVRLSEAARTDLPDVRNLYVPLPDGAQVPLSAVARVELVDAPMQISRENTNRRVVIGVNVGDTDVATLVERIRSKLDTELDLPTGYYFTYGGQFENLRDANARLRIVVPLALALIFFLLYFTFGSWTQAVLVFVAIPLSAIGGIWALELRGMPFSISAGIGFIALFGVAVLNGIVLIAYFNRLKTEGMTDVRQRIIEGTRVRLRPVLLTAAVASLGFLPMALSQSGGAEVQRPLATVVIGGLITATFLTLVVLPILYGWLEERRGGRKMIGTTALVGLLLLATISQQAQTTLSMEGAVEMVLQNRPELSAAELRLAGERSLLDLPYQAGSTEISYQGDGLFRENGQRVNQLGVVQYFPHPATQRARNAVTSANIGQLELERERTAREITLLTRETYLDLQYRRARSQLWQRSLARYDRYVRLAEVRVEVGETNRLELLNLRAARNRIALQLQQSDRRADTQAQQLALLLGVTEPLRVDTLRLMAFPLTTSDSTGLALRFAEQRIQTATAATELLAAEKQPTFSAGYATQRFFEDGWLHGLQAGVTVPLFNRNLRRRIEARQLTQQAATTDLEAVSQQLRRQRLQLRGELERAAAAVDFYRQQLDELQPELERIARLNYRAGEINYLEVLRVLDLRTETAERYLEQVLAYNQAVVRYQFLFN